MTTVVSEDVWRVMMIIWDRCSGEPPYDASPAERYKYIEIAYDNETFRGLLLK